MEDKNTTAAESWREHSFFRKSVSQDKAQGYEDNRFCGSRRMQRLHEQETAFAQKVMDLAGPQASVLDVPCGSGRFYPIFSAARQLTMVDYSVEMLNAVRAKYGQGNSLNLLQGDITDLPFGDGSFDLVFSMRLLHHIGDDELRRGIIRQLARVSSRYVALSVYSKHSFRYIKRRILGKRPSGNSVVLSEFIAEAQRAGLKLISKYPAVSFVEQQRMLLFEKA